MCQAKIQSGARCCTDYEARQITGRAGLLLGGGAGGGAGGGLGGVGGWGGFGGLFLVWGWGWGGGGGCWGGLGSGERGGGPEDLASRIIPVMIGKKCAPCHHVAPSHKAGPE